MGREFSFNILYSIIYKVKQDFSKEELLDCLKTAINNQLISETLSETGEILYKFNHDKIVETLNSQIQERNFKLLHKHAAEVIEEKYLGVDKTYRLAYHYIKANRRNKAYKYNYESGKKALESYSYKLAFKFFNQALNLLRNYSTKTKIANQKRIALTIQVAEINFQLGRFQENIDILEEIIPIAEEIKDKENLAKTFFLIGRMYNFMGKQKQGMKYYNKALPIAEDLNIKEILAIIYSSIGRTEAYTCYYEDAIQDLRKGINAFPQEKKDDIERMYPMGMLIQSLGYSGHGKETRDVIHEISNFAKVDNDTEKLWIFFYICVGYSLVGDYEKCLDTFKIAYEFSKKLKNPSIESVLLLFKSRALYYKGEIKNAIHDLTEAIDIAKKINFKISFFVYLFYISEYYIENGNISMAKQFLEESLTDIYIEGANPDYIYQWEQRLRAFIELTSTMPDLEKASEHIENSISLVKDMGDVYKYHQGLNYVIKSFILKKNEKEETAREFFESAIEIFNKLELYGEVERSNRLKEKFYKTFEETGTEDFESTDTTFTRSTSMSQTDFFYHRQLKYLLKLSEKLAQIHDMTSLMKMIMQLAIEVSGAERGILFLYDELQDNELKVKVTKSINPGEEKKQMAFSEKILNTTLERRKGKLVIDAEKELVDDKIVKKYNMKSIMTVPLITSGKILGAIYLDNRQVKGLFTKENFELLKAFAIEAAISIENARLYEKVKQTARIEQEMKIAQDIQTSILPNIKETLEYNIASFMRTATEVGGDYYDFYLEDEPYFGIFGDVAGHGLKSGLVMMMCEVAFNAIMRDKDLRQKNLQIIYQIINSTLFENIQNRLVKKSIMGSDYSSLYMTLRLFRFDKQGNFEIFGNDHAEPFLCSTGNGKKIQTLESKGFLIGLENDAVKQNETIKFKLEKDDVLVLYSDGISEAKKAGKQEQAKREMFGEKKLHEIVYNNMDKPPSEIIQCVLNQVDDFMYEQEDDITLVVIKKN